MVQVTRILANLDLVAQELPVVHDQRRRGAASHGEVEHHRPDPAFAMAPLAHVGKNGVHVASARGTCRLADESAQEDTVDAVLPHPVAVQQHRSFAEAAV